MKAKTCHWQLSVGGSLFKNRAAAAQKLRLQALTLLPGRDVVHARKPCQGAARTRRLQVLGRSGHTGGRAQHHALRGSRATAPADQCLPTRRAPAHDLQTLPRRATWSEAASPFGHMVKCAHLATGKVGAAARQQSMRGHR